MSDVTGPISSLPGEKRVPPEGTMCDEHPLKLAVARIQGETDSFGSEQNDLCLDCCELSSVAQKEYSEEVCDWCKNIAVGLQYHRDWEEGSCGPVYRVCGYCIEKNKFEDPDYEYGPDYDWESEYNPNYD